MSTTSLTADGLIREYAEEPSEERTLCARCYEPVYFVVGIAGPARWKHVATHDHVCQPSCKHCGKAAHNRVSDGYGQHYYWECHACSNKTFRIERT